MRRATSRVFLLLATAPLLVACDPRFHLIGEWDGGRAPGTPDGSSNSAGPGQPGVSPGADGGSAADAGPPAQAAPLAISPRDALVRVASVLWHSPPDAAQLAMADSGAIRTSADVRVIARNMLNDSRSRVGVAAFYRWWLDLDRLATVQKDPNLFPFDYGAIALLMGRETEAFGVHATLEDGRFATLMTAPYSFLNESLAQHYGVTGVGGADLRRVGFSNGSYRAGIFTQGALQMFLSNHGLPQPIHRGVFMRMKMLCSAIPSPPPEVDPSPGARAPGESDRQHLTRVTGQPVCAGCHSQFDPLGFAYDVFDAVGRVRQTDSTGMPIDATGTLVDGALTTTFDGPVDLASLLSGLTSARRCMGQQWLEYMLGRGLEAADNASVDAIHQQFTAAGFDLRALIAAVASSASFLAPNGGPPCTPGLDQTCNHDPLLSSTRGTCTSAARCVCGAGSAVHPLTGRCTN